jgi:hypothetical protein
MMASEAIRIVEDMCGGSDGFSRVFRVMGDDWDSNLEAFCHQRITPEEYVENCRVMYEAYKLHEFNRKFEETLVNSRSKK